MVTKLDRAAWLAMESLSPMPFGRTVFGHRWRGINTEAIWICLQCLSAGPSLVTEPTNRNAGIPHFVSNAFRQDRLWSHVQPALRPNLESGLQCLSAGPSLVTECRIEVLRRDRVSNAFRQDRLWSRPPWATSSINGGSSPMPFGRSVFGHGSLLRRQPLKKT